MHIQIMKFDGFSKNRFFFYIFRKIHITKILPERFIQKSLQLANCKSASRPRKPAGRRGARLDSCCARLYG